MTEGVLSSIFLSPPDISGTANPQMGTQKQSCISNVGSPTSQEFSGLDWESSEVFLTTTIDISGNCNSQHENSETSNETGTWLEDQRPGYLPSLDKRNIGTFFASKGIRSKVCSKCHLKSVEISGFFGGEEVSLL